MARVAPKVIRHGTAKDAADVGVGYVASGAGEYTRQAAHSANIKLPNYVVPKAPQWTRTALEQLGEKIAFQTRALAKLHIDLILEKSAERRAKIEKNIGIKSAFLERLKSENGKR